MGPFSLRTMSEHGLLLLKLVFQMQDALQKYAEAKEADRIKAAKLLRKMALCLKDIDEEIAADQPNTAKHAASMRVYLSKFKSRFEPVMGETEASRIEGELKSLFAKTDDENGSMISGFLALKDYGHRGDVDERHVEASLMALVQVMEQLEAMADVIEFE